MRRSIEHTDAFKAYAAARAETATLDGAPTETFEERMARQRAEWRAHDVQRFLNPDKCPETDAIWHVYAWMPRKREWRFVGERPIRNHRRKPMTMNRLFAAIRQRYGLRKRAVIKLISATDDAVRQRRGEKLAPPQRFGRDFS